jgi:hypothetical protein
MSGFPLSRWFRGLGTASFIGAGAAFLVEGWTDAGVFKRQALWAIATVVMTICGVASIRRYRDAIGARLFLGLAAGTIPVHFAQVGASFWALETNNVGTFGQVLAAMAILPVLVLPLVLGVSVLVRKHARLLVFLMFATGCPLILPTRNGNIVALLGVLEMAVCLCAEAFLFRKDAQFRTVEGISARVLLFLPSMILLGRNVFYETPPLWVAAMLGAPSFAMLVLPRIWSRTDPESRGFQVAGALGVVSAAVIAAPGASTLGLILSGVALLGSEIIIGRPAAFAWGAAGFLAAAGVGSFIHPNPWLIVAAVPIGTLHVMSAFRRRDAQLTLATSIITAVSTAGHLVKLVHFPNHDVWVPAVVLSVVFLGLGSVVEHRRDRIQRGVSRLQSHFRPKA